MVDGWPEAAPGCSNEVVWMLSKWWLGMLKYRLVHLTLCLPIVSKEPVFHYLLGFSVTVWAWVLGCFQTVQSVMATKLWNFPPREIVLSPCIAVICQLVKTSLFYLAYPQWLLLTPSLFLVVFVYAFLFHYFIFQKLSQLVCLFLLPWELCFGGNATLKCLKLIHFKKIFAFFAIWVLRDSI